MSIFVRKKQAEALSKRVSSERGQLRRKKPPLSALGLPEDVIGGQARLTMMGDSRVLVENHRGIVEISDTRMRVMARGGILAVSGEHLELSEVRKDALAITGDIRAVELPGGIRKEADGNA